MIPPFSLVLGDSFDTMQHIEDGAVDLIYLDPPFNSNRDYNLKASQKIEADQEEDDGTQSFTDIYSYDTISDEQFSLVEANASLMRFLEFCDGEYGERTGAYLTYMAVRLVEMRRILKRKQGHIWLHCHDTAAHQLRILLDCVFGAAKFVNAIAWHKNVGQKTVSVAFPKNKDTILCYGEGGLDLTTMVQEVSPELEASYQYEDEVGRYKLNHIGGIKYREVGKGNYAYPIKGEDSFGNDVVSEGPWRITEATFNERCDQGLIEFNDKGQPMSKTYLTEKSGVMRSDVWDDIGIIKGGSNIKYPTQKPYELLERIVTISTKEGDTVLDPFMGSGVTLRAADNLGRGWIGSDISPFAIETALRLFGGTGKEVDGLDRLENPISVLTTED